MSATILVVDDEKNIRDLLEQHFSAMNFKVFTAESATDALAILAEQRIEVVISDIVMPVMKGTDLLKIIKTEYPMTHVIMTTGYVSLENALECMRRGADICVFKPFNDFEELDAAVIRAIDALKRWHSILMKLKKGKKNA